MGCSGVHCGTFGTVCTCSAHPTRVRNTYTTDVLRHGCQGTCKSHTMRGVHTLCAESVWFVQCLQTRNCGRCTHLYTFFEIADEGVIVGAYARGRDGLVGCASCTRHSAQAVATRYWGLGASGSGPSAPSRCRSPPSDTATSHASALLRNSSLGRAPHGYEGLGGAHRALCARCAKSRLFSTTGSHGSQGPEFCTPVAVLN